MRHRMTHLQGRCQVFETVYEVKFLQGPNKRPYIYRAFTPNIKLGSTVVVDVNPDGYKLARVVEVKSFHAHTARNYAVKIVAMVDDAFYQEQKKLSALLDQATRNVQVHMASVKAAEDAVVDLAKRRAALADAREHERSVRALKVVAESNRLRRLDNGDENTARYWMDKVDQAAGREVAYQKGPLMGSALAGAPDPFYDETWGDC